MSDKSIKLSIVTVCYNAEKNIEKTLESVLQQNYEEYEYIIIDGMSKDATVTILKEYDSKFREKKVSFRYVSEKDDGIYDAMNKGIRCSAGEWLYFLNAGDIFKDNNVLINISQLLCDDNDVIYGETIYKVGSSFRYRPAGNIDEITKDMIFCHQSSFVKSNVMKEYMFDAKYDISADYDFFLRCYKNGKRFLKIERVIAVFDMDGVSSTKGITMKKQFASSQYKCGYINKMKYIVTILMLNIKLIAKKVVIILGGNDNLRRRRMAKFINSTQPYNL